MSDIDALTAQRMGLNEQILAKRVGSKWSEAPADAQLALHSWAWAVGPEAEFPHLIQCLQGERYALFDIAGALAGGSAIEIRIQDVHNNNALARRNLANRALMLAAQHVADTDAPKGFITGWPQVGV